MGAGTHRRGRGRRPAALLGRRRLANGGDGKGDGKGNNKDFQAGKIEPWENDWHNKIGKSQSGLQGRCRFHNAGCGCSRGNQCRFKNECFLCGENHAMVAHHTEGECEPWA